MEEKIWQLISLKLSGDASPEQLDELDFLLKEHPDLAFQVSMVLEIWRGKTKRPVLNTDAMFNRHLQRLSNHLSEDALRYEVPVEEDREVINTGKRTSRVIWWAIGGVAASLLLAVLLLSKGTNSGNAPLQVAKNSVSTKNGSKSKIQLPDGTQVWLNSGSTITYDNDFLGPTREVTLKGEAFFDVVKDKNRPLIIHTTAIDIKVLGTTFNVHSYPDEKLIETSLISGSVEITIRSKPGKTILLKPSEKLIVQNDAVIPASNALHHDKKLKDQPVIALTQVHYAVDSSNIETLWIKNKLAFENATLEQVALKLERWYGVKVIITNARIKDTEYSGVFDDENLSEVLLALKLSGNFNYSLKKNEVIIY